MLKTMFYVSTLSNFKYGYNKYSNEFKKFNLSKFKDKFFLLNKEELHIGINKNIELIKRLNNPKDKIVIIETSTSDKLFSDHETGIGQYIKKDSIIVKNLFLNDLSTPISVEELMSLSYRVEGLTSSFVNLIPRSFSFLPIAKGCQAKCPFCFSDGSISSDFKGSNRELINLEKMAELSKRRGSERAVITGGGEPTLLRHEQLLESIKILKKHFKTIVLITNAYNYSLMKEDELIKTLKELINAGLTVLNVSRHHYDEEKNKQIMNLNIPSERIANCIKNNNLELKMRFTCVLQKNGIEKEKDILNFINFAGQNNVNEICFKELYVSSSTESVYFSQESNNYSRNNQVPLSTLCSVLENQGYKVISELPWGSPVYSNNKMRIAAYTEPSTGWELSNGIARSWNLMADGRTFASLEDKESLISD